MKTLVALLFFWFVCANSQAQNASSYEVKVVSYQYKTVKGYLKKVNAEGIGIEDYKGNYIIYRTADIKRIKVKKRGLSFGKAVGGGTLIGLSAGAGLWSLDETGESTADMAKLTALLTATGAVLGSAVGGIAELSHQRLTLNVKGSAEYFKLNYKRLERYVDPAELTQHVSN